MIKAETSIPTFNSAEKQAKDPREREVVSMWTQQTNRPCRHLQNGLPNSRAHSLPTWYEYSARQDIDGALKQVSINFKTLNSYKVPSLTAGRWDYMSTGEGTQESHNLWVLSSTFLTKGRWWPEREIRWPSEEWREHTDPVGLLGKKLQMPAFGNGKPHIHVRKRADPKQQRKKIIKVTAE